MSNIKDLPGAGHGFRVTAGVGNFTKKFTSATRFGNLHNLSDNRSSILKVIKKHEAVIKMGKFGRLRQIGAWNEIKKLEGNKLTKDDKKEIKQILKHLSSRKDLSSGGEGGPKVQMQLAHDDGYEKERLEGIKAKVGMVNRSDTTGEAKLNFASDPGFNKIKTDRELVKDEYGEADKEPVKKEVKKVNKDLAKDDSDEESLEEKIEKKVKSRFNASLSEEDEKEESGANAVINKVINRHLKPRGKMLKDRLSPKVFEPTKAPSYSDNENKKDRRSIIKLEKDKNNNTKEKLNPEFFQNL